MRARRAAEETERKERQREKEELIKRKAETLDLVNSRKQQGMDLLRIHEIPCLMLFFSYIVLTSFPFRRLILSPLVSFSVLLS